MEADVTDAITLQGALRWEDYSSFGDTLNWKIGGKVDVSENFVLRSTYSTGFHAPTAGQANVINITTAFVGGVLADVGTLPLTSTAGQFINDRRTSRGEAPFELGPEESKNFSIGFAGNMGDLEITVDYFNIALDGRIATTSNQDFREELFGFGVDNGVTLMVTRDDDGNITTATSQLINSLNGVGGFNAGDFAGSEDLASFVVFANNFDTKTQGIDVVATYPFDLGSGSSSITAAANWTETEVTNRGRFADIGDLRTQSLEGNIPDLKGNVTFNHEQGSWRGLLRANFHSGYFEDHLGTNGFPIDLGGEVNFDAEVTYAMDNGAEISVGAANLLDNYPDRLDEIASPIGTTSIGAIAGPEYPSTAPFGFNGGQWYVRARYAF